MGENVKFVRPKVSNDDREMLVKDAEDVLRRLEIPYRLIVLCTGYMGFGQAKTYDLEAWCPGEDRFLEVSSCPNYNDFQARRANLRYRRKDGKVAYRHTLNGPGRPLPLAVSSPPATSPQADATLPHPPAPRPVRRRRRALR